MNAAVLEDPGQPLALLDVARPVLQADEELLRVDICGGCHSDLHIVDGDTPGLQATTKAPLIPGHEVVGIVVERGADVTHLELDLRVGVAWLQSACRACAQCRERNENPCRRRIVTGMMVDRGYADFMRAEASHALPVPDALRSIEAAPLFCTGVTSYRALNNAGAARGHVAADKLAAARALGAAHHIDARASDAAKSDLAPWAVPTLPSSHRRYGRLTTTHSSTCGPAGRCRSSVCRPSRSPSTHAPSSPASTASLAVPSIPATMLAPRWTSLLQASRAAKFTRVGSTRSMMSWHRCAGAASGVAACGCRLGTESTR